MPVCGSHARPLVPFVLKQETQQKEKEKKRNNDQIDADADADTFASQHPDPPTSREETGLVTPFFFKKKRSFFLDAFKKRSNPHPLDFLGGVVERKEVCLQRFSAGSQDPREFRCCAPSLQNFIRV